MAKKIPSSKKNRIRKEYEHGNDLLDLAIKYQINYGTLRNIASKEKWIKSGAIAVAKIKELFEAADVIVERRVQIKKEYQVMTQELRENLVNGDYPEKKSEEEALKNRVQAIKDLYELDKELHGIWSDPEIIKMKVELAKYEELKKSLGEDGTDGPEENSDIQEARNMLLKAKGVKR
jgi:hypothetical protein|uniref:Uncharacterized protein n=1 Tax=Myoviridae sp. ctZ2t4 TaxID=2827693 RepID=A0A8S5SS89_9CAUD|nr:MAG TPA: hypothetical protein [Myoviridae sp. ctZ2t4]